jgi:hypothetical protein
MSLGDAGRASLGRGRIPRYSLNGIAQTVTEVRLISSPPGREAEVIDVVIAGAGPGRLSG